MKNLIIISLLIVTVLITQSCKSGKHLSGDVNNPKEEIQKEEAPKEVDLTLSDNNNSKIEPEEINVIFSEEIPLSNEIEVDLTSSINRIIHFYTEEFDTLIEKTTLELLIKDEHIIKEAKSEDKNLLIKIKDLQNYHNAKLLLSKQYNEVEPEINKAIKLLNMQKVVTNETAKLRNLLINYGYTKNQLDSLIRKVNLMKKGFDGLSVKAIIVDIKDEMKVFLNENNDIAAYPQLFKVFNKILEEKEKNLNEDILFLLKEL